MALQKRISVVFYRQQPSGKEPVRDWLRELTVEERKIVGADIKAVEYRWPLGLPLVRPMDNKLWEIRSHLPTTIARVFFTIVAGRLLVLLHVFIKKTQATPPKELDIAKRRRDDVHKKGGINYGQ